MAVSRAKEALAYMRIAVGNQNLEIASQWALVYLVEDRATQVGFEMRERYEAEHLESLHD